MTRVLFAVALLSSLAATAAKRPQIPVLGETIDVNIVNIDVVVTDRDGRRVRGLGKDDFVIFEDGKPREISNFAEYASALPGEDVAVSVDSPPAQVRTVLFFIERETKLQPFEAGRFIESLRSTVRATIRRGDSVGVVIWGDTAHVRVDFTDDLDRIDLVLDTLHRDLTGAQRKTPAQLVTEVDDIMNFELEIAARAAELDIPYTVSDRSIVTEHVGAMNAMSELTRMKRKVNAINAAIDSMAGAEGKKVLLLATHRLGEIAGGDFYYEADADGNLLSQDVRTRFSTRGLIDSIVRNANAAGVTIYPVYPTGRPVEGSAGASEYLTVMNEMQSLRRIAAQTGGVEASGTAEFVSLMQRVEDDMTDYYSLAYRIESSRDDRKRDLAVRTRDATLTVRARRSYVEKSDQTRMKDRLMAALVRMSNDSMFLIEAELGGAKKRRGTRGQVPLQVRIPIGALTVVPDNGANVGVFTVFVLAGAGGDEVSALRQQTQRFEIPPAELAKAMSGHFTYELDLVMSEHADRVAVGVLDEVSKSYAVLRLPVSR